MGLKLRLQGELGAPKQWAQPVKTPGEESDLHVAEGGGDRALEAVQGSFITPQEL